MGRVFLCRAAGFKGPRVQHRLGGTSASASTGDSRAGSPGDPGVM